jgi:hypothetical protein
MVGRKPLGPALVEHLEGSTSAKQRLELILATIAGQVSVVDAAERLGICEAMFHKLRNRVLQTSLADLEPKPIGRPSRQPSVETVERDQLAQRVRELERELTAQTVRLELAQTLPHVVRPAETSASKKAQRHQRRKELLRRQRTRRK